MNTLNCKGKLLDLTHPQLMGILNITPDSFFAGSRVQAKDDLLYQADSMLKHGAKILDVGGVSTRPGAAKISVEEELNRVLPVIQALHQYFPEAILSIDTFQAKVAQEAIREGAHILNDISAWNINENLLDVLARHNNVPYILMHMQGTPQTMQTNPTYQDLLLDIMDFFIEKIGILKQKKIKDIVLDVGFGFGKTIPQNYRLLNNLHIFDTLQRPMLVGVSRKSMIWRLLEGTPGTALNGTTALHLVALQQGAKILRVHDVKEANEVIKIWQQLNENN
jgi:dihydropteroate synthase